MTRYRVSILRVVSEMELKTSYLFPEIVVLRSYKSFDLKAKLVVSNFLPIYLENESKGSIVSVLVQFFVYRLSKLGAAIANLIEFSVALNSSVEWQAYHFVSQYLLFQFVVIHSQYFINVQQRMNYVGGVGSELCLFTCKSIWFYTWALEPSCSALSCPHPPRIGTILATTPTS